MSEHSCSDDIKVGLVVLCGIPGSGKSTLASMLSNHLQVEHSHTRAIHICYDELLPRDIERKIITQNSNDETEGTSKWKLYRKVIFNSVEGLIRKVRLKEVNPKPGDTEVEDGELFEDTQRKICHKFDETFSSIHRDLINIVFIIDDNMYYRSMRYSYFQLAKRYTTGFVQVYITCPKHLAIERNQTRGEPVDKDVILTMDSKLEAPSPDLNKWEENSYVIDSMGTDMKTRLPFVFDKIKHSLENPVPPDIEEDIAEKAESREICSKSSLHQIDQILRQLVQNHMKTSARNMANMAHQAKIANSAKAHIFSEFKHGKLTLGSMGEITDSSKHTDGPLYKHITCLFNVEINSRSKH